MFAPPSVANAKAAQAIQAVATPQLAINEKKPSSSDASTRSDERTMRRKKSDPVLSKSAPTFLQDSSEVERERNSGPPATPSSVDVDSLDKSIQAMGDAANGSNSGEQTETAGENGSVLPFLEGCQEGVAILSSASNASSRASKNAASNMNAQLAISTPSVETGKKKNKRSKRSAWYSLISSTYKTKCEDFRRLFKDVPQGEMLIVDYSCALQRDILLHGRLYVTQNYLCFRSNIFGWETTVVIKCKDITSMTKEKTALVIPNAIQCSTEKGDRYFFASFAARDKSYLMLFRLWQNALLKQPMSTAECWRWIHYSYGDELGLSTDDEDYIPPDDITTCRSIDIRSLTELPVEEAELARPPSASGISVTTSAQKSYANSSSIISDQEQDLDTCSSDEQEADAKTCPHAHDTKECFNRCFLLDIDHVFTCLFTASEFYQAFQTGRKVTNLVINNWNPSESADVKQERTLTYNVNLNHAMAKNCVTTEKQNLHRRSKPGKMYFIDCEYLNSGVPYADSFVINQHFCLVSEGENRCRLRIFSGIEFRKQVWSFMKGMIERNAWQGTNDFMDDLQKALDQEAFRSAAERGQIPPTVQGTEDARKNLIFAENEKKPLSDSGITSCQRSKNIFFIVSCVVVAVLLVVNIYLMYKNYANELSLMNEGVEDVPNTAIGWKSAYMRNQVRHRRQLEDLQRLVDRSLQGLENMKLVFIKVKEIAAQKVVALPPNSKNEL